MTMQEVKNNVDRLCYLSDKQAKTKREIDELKGYFENLAEASLKDTKLKTVTYWGNDNKKVSVSNSETVKIVSDAMCKNLFKSVYEDLFKLKQSYDMTAPCKRILANAFLGNYIAGDIHSVISQITDVESIQSILHKKLKGNFEKDKALLITQISLSEEEAGDWAYLIQETLNYESLKQILNTAGFEGTLEDAVRIIKSCIVVEEGIKVTIESED